MQDSRCSQDKPKSSLWEAWAYLHSSTLSLYTIAEVELVRPLGELYLLKFEKKTIESYFQKMLYTTLQSKLKDGKEVYWSFPLSSNF